MSQCSTVSGASAPDRLSRLIQKHVFGDRIKIPLEIRLWGGRTYRFGTGEPVVKILVKDRKGLSALRRLDELRICEAYMNGSLDVQGDMLGFASLRPGLHDRHPLHDLWPVSYTHLDVYKRQAVSHQLEQGDSDIAKYHDIGVCFGSKGNDH